MAPKIVYPNWFPGMAVDHFAWPGEPPVRTTIAKVVARVPYVHLIGYDNKPTVRPFRPSGHAEGLCSKDYITPAVDD